MSDDYLWDGSGDPPPDVVRLETLLRPLRHGAPRAPVVERARPGSLAAAVLLAAVAGAAAWSVGRAATDATRPSWGVARLEGVPNAKYSVATETGRLRLGGWLETSSDDFARVEVADIGEVVVWPDSRLGLVATGAGRHMLQLDRGRLDATVDAPPRLFFIRTPSALVVDLGCAYSLETDAAGDGTLRVTSGAVAIPRDGGEAVIPAGAQCTLRAGRGPGTPTFEDAPEALVRAVAVFDDTGDLAAVTEVLDSVRAPDTMTLWNLLSHAGPADRERLVARIEELVPLPDGISRAAILRDDVESLDAWYEVIEWEW